MFPKGINEVNHKIASFRFELSLSPFPTLLIIKLHALDGFDGK